MGWIIDNPIGTMYGPYFLVFYFVVIVATIVICTVQAGRVDASNQFGAILVPTKPDPYEFAHLRGGDYEVARLMIYELLHRNMLQKISDKPITLRALSIPMDSAGLSSTHLQVLRFFQDAKAPHTLLASPVMSTIEVMCRPFAANAELNRLTVAAIERSRLARIKWTGLIVIAGLGVYKLVAALCTGHDNVGFLICLGLLGAIILLVSCKAPRLTQRGIRFIKNTQTAFNQLRRMPGPTLPGRADVSPILTVGLFGFAALADTDQAPYAQMFARSSSVSGGGCGSSTSSCGSSGGCGGGGGDGGGGGCGGCGGGGD